MTIRSQDLKKRIMTQELLVLLKRNIFKNKKPNFFGFEIERFKAIDIDTEQDWKLVKKIYKSI